MFQCKRHKKLTTSTIRSSVDKFLEGGWSDASESFTICVSQDASDTKLLDESEKQRERLADNGHEFELWDSEYISERLRSSPEIVSTFFGDAWVVAFCDSGPATRWASKPVLLPDREVRATLRAFYERLFQRYDPVADASGSSARFIAPDVVIDRRLNDIVEPDSHSSKSTNASDGFDHAERANGTSEESLVTERISALDLIQSSRHTLLLGGPGSGKSTLLRWLCLDALAEQPECMGPGGIASSSFLCVWVPFGRWVQAIATGQHKTSLEDYLQDMLHAFSADSVWPALKQALDDQRVALVVDGLDEWTNLDAAQVAGERLQQFVSVRNCLVVASSRQEGLRAFGHLDDYWSRAELAGLSSEQQIAMLTEEASDQTEAKNYLAQIDGIPQVRAMAKTPLLLKLMWLLNSDGIKVPSSKPLLINEVIGWMLREQAPRRRLASGTVRLGSLSDQEFLDSLAAVAHRMQTGSASVLDEDEVEKVILSRLSESDSQIFTNHDLRSESRAAISEAAGPVGLLVKTDSSTFEFAHRAFEEHLAAREIARWDPPTQIAECRSRSRDASWVEVIESVVWHAKTTREADALLDVIAEPQASSDDFEKCGMVLARVVASASECSPAARKRAADRVVRNVCKSGRSDVRSSALMPLIDALGDADIGEHLAAQLRPRLLSFTDHRSEALVATRGWADDGLAHAIWWECLLDEDVGTARTAGRLIADAYAGSDEGRDKLSSLLGQPQAPMILAALLECADLGWSGHDRFEALLARARRSSFGDIKLVAIQHAVRNGSQTAEDRDFLIDALGRLGVSLSHERQRGVLELLADGWPNDAVLEKLVFDGVAGRGADGFRTGEQWYLLARLFLDLPDAQEALIAEASRPRPSFYMLHSYAAMRDLGSSATRFPEVRKALEAYTQRQEVIGILEISGLCLGLKTEFARDQLIELLVTGRLFGSLGWPAGALYEGWEGDETAMGAIRAVAENGTDDAADFADLIPKIFDRDVADRILLGLIPAAEHRRVSSLLFALKDSNDPSVRSKAVDLALERVGDDSEWEVRIADMLIAHFADDDRVEKLFEPALQSANVSLAALAHAGKLAPSIIPATAERLIPLAPTFRRATAQRLAVSPRTELGFSIASDWHQEPDGMTAAALASAFAKQRPDPLRLRTTAEKAMRGPRLYEERMQAGFCALLEADDLDAFSTMTWGTENRPLGIEVATYTRRNWWLLSRVAAKLDEVISALGEDFVERLTFGNDRQEFWASLAPFAISHETASDRILEFVRNEGTGGRDRLCTFLAISRPRSAELRSELLRAILACRGGSVNDIRHLIHSVELLEEHFAGDAATLEALVSLSSDLPPRITSLALATCWPNAPETDEHFAQLKEDQQHAPFDIAVRISLARSSAKYAIRSFTDWIEASEHGVAFVDPPVRKLTSRIAADKAFADSLAARVQLETSPSVLSSGARGLAAAGMLDDELRAELEQRIPSYSTGSNVDMIGLDIYSNEYRPVFWSLTDALRSIQV